MHFFTKFIAVLFYFLRLNVYLPTFTCFIPACIAGNHLKLVHQMVNTSTQSAPDIPVHTTEQLECAVDLI